MIGKLPDQSQGNLFSTPLVRLLNPQHPLFLLANEIDWKKFEDEFGSLYSHTGRPSAPIRLMVSLLILKQLDNLGDETVLQKWIENPYFQYFSGMDVFQWKMPIDPTDLVYFRKRIGEPGVELILKASIEIHGEDAREDQIVADTTVQEKAITYPTDAKLYKRVIDHCRKIAKKEGTEMRQSYVRVVPRLMRQQFNAHHPKRRKKARSATQKLRTIAGRLLRELERNLGEVQMLIYQRQIDLYWRVLNQQRSDKDKVYSLHAPEVACIAKGKAHPKFEFGSKVSIAKTKTTGIIVAAVNFRGNPYDGHTLKPTLDQHENLTGFRARICAADRGYRGLKEIGTTQVIIPDKPKKRDTYYKRRKKKLLMRRRAAIEPVIGHLKARFRLKRNWLKGTKGDQINLTLAAAAFNFKKWMNKKMEEWIFIFLNWWVWLIAPARLKKAG